MDPDAHLGRLLISTVHRAATVDTWLCRPAILLLSLPHGLSAHEDGGWRSPWHRRRHLTLTHARTISLFGLLQPHSWFMEVHVTHVDKSELHSGISFALQRKIQPLSTGVAVKIELEPGAENCLHCQKRKEKTCGEWTQPERTGRRWCSRPDTRWCLGLHTQPVLKAGLLMGFSHTRATEHPWLWPVLIGFLTFAMEKVLTQGSWPSYLDLTLAFARSHLYPPPLEFTKHAFMIHSFESKS